jgi:hypothetical protein
MEPYPVHMRIMPRGAPGSLIAALGGKVVVPPQASWVAACVLLSF